MFTGVCLSRWGVPGPGGACSGGAWSWGVSGLGVPGPRGVWSGGPGGDPPPMATAAGGTHPTGMHSYFNSFLNIKTVYFRMVTTKTSLKSNEWKTHSSLQSGYDVRSSKTTSMDGKCKQVIILPYSAFQLRT